MMADTFAPQGMGGGTGVLLRDVATLKSTTTPAEVDRYNELLNQYLGARCHV